VTYGLAGTLDMYELKDRLALIHAERPAAVTAIAMFLVVAFSVKAALFPFHFWLPPSYHVPAAGVSALFAALLTKVGVYSLLRLLTLPFAAVKGPEVILGFLAALTMLFGVFGAVTRFEMRSILAWHSISQVGYMVVGMALLAAPSSELRIAGIAATVFFIIHHGLVKPALFLVAGLVGSYQGTTQLKNNGGLYLARPLLAVVFLLAALSLAGIPPLSGFWAKLAIIQAALAAEQGWLAGAALAAGLVTLLSMVKIWIEAFWKPRPEGGDTGNQPSGNLHARWSATLALVALITLIGLAPEPILSWSYQAATEVLAHRSSIVTAEVLP
jgi:multicomponent Na+:H+ antiporter subunit D